MNIFEKIYSNINIFLINLPKLYLRNNDSFNFYKLRLKQKISTTGYVELKKSKFEFSTDSIKTYQRFTKVLEKEPDTIKWIDSFSKGDVFWDIGANVGVFTFYASYCGIKTYSFEPDPLNYKELIKMMILNKCRNISPFLIGIGSKDLGYFDLEFEDDGLDSGRSMRTLNTSGILKHNSIKTLTMSLKSIASQFNIEYPNHIKIDVDGNELSILEGQQDFLSNLNIKSVLIEIDESDDNSLNRIINLMLSCGFKIEKSIESAVGSKYINYIFRK